MRTVYTLELFIAGARSNRTRMSGIGYTKRNWLLGGTGWRCIKPIRQMKDGWKTYLRMWRCKCRGQTVRSSCPGSHSLWSSAYLCQHQKHNIYRQELEVIISLNCSQENIGVCNNLNSGWSEILCFWLIYSATPTWLLTGLFIVQNVFPPAVVVTQDELHVFLFESFLHRLDVVNHLIHGYKLWQPTNTSEQQNTVKTTFRSQSPGNGPKNEL